MAAKGLYGVSNLVDSKRQREAFYGAGGLGRMQGLLTNASISDRVHRKVASLCGDLALRGEVSTQSALLHLIGLQPAAHVSHVKRWSRSSRFCLRELLLSGNRGPHLVLMGVRLPLVTLKRVKAQRWWTNGNAVGDPAAQGEAAREGDASVRPYKAGPSYMCRNVLLMLQEFLHQMAKLPEKGREVVRSLSQHISARDWDLSERAMHALHNIASAHGARHAFVVRSRFCSLDFCCKLPKHA